MKPLSLLFAVALILSTSAVCFAQTKAKIVPAIAEQNSVTQTLRSSPAFAELLLRKTELQSELESLLLEYTEEFPKVKQNRQALVILHRESGRLLGVKPAESSKLTLALGKLMVRKIDLETDLWALLNNYKDEHPDVKRAKRKVAIYEAAIKEILD